MKNKFNILYPVGYEIKKELTVVVLGLVAALLYSFTYFDKYFDCYSALFDYIGDKKILLDYMLMEDFYIILGSSLTGFLAFLIIPIFYAVLHYTYHYNDSKSIYLMKRLPEKNELHIRCLALPLIYIAVSLFCALLLLLLYYLFYITFTPDKCLTPDQLGKLWRSIL